MRFTCFPLSVKNFNQKLPQVKKPKSDSDDIQTPTVGEYTNEAAKQFLAALQAVAAAIPVPGFSIAVKLATNIMQACEESHATLERAQELKLRIKALVLTLVNELKGKKAEEIHAKIIQDVEVLKEDMHYINRKLDEIASQHRILVVLFRNLNNDRVRKCVARLDNSLETFKLSRDFEHTDILTRLEKQISAFHAQQQLSLNELQASVKGVQLTMDDVKAMLDKRLPADASSSPQTRAAIPTNTSIFYGRNAIVAELVGVIIAESRKHVCLLGPGGMGKTLTSLAVLHDPAVEVHFSEHLRVWVPCVKAPSSSLFLETLCVSLGISKDTRNPLSNILSVLKTSPPIVLLLDNFETPWNAEGGQSDVEQILREIDRIPCVTLFITMRSSSPPCGDLLWHRVDLRAVDAAAAQNIYTSWHPHSRNDPDLADLLELIDRMPLAITLMAKFASSAGLSAKTVIKEYNDLGTTVMDQGLDAKTSMDICIGLSVTSPLMRAHPKAFDLLCSLSMLPAGTSYNMLSKWWARGLIGELGILKNAALVEQRASIIYVLPVIQRYVLHESRFLKQVGSCMIKNACNFLKEHVDRNEHHEAHAATVSAEEGNLEAVLLTTTTPDIHVLRDGFLLLAHHQQLYTNVKSDVIECALSLAHLVGDIDPVLHGNLIFCHAESLRHAGQFDKPIKQYKAALDLFLSVPDRKRAAECRLKLSHLQTRCGGDFDECRQIILEATEDYKAVGDEVGAARCLLFLGWLFMYEDDYSTALAHLLQAHSVLVLARDRYYSDECAQAISRVYYRMGKYDLAHNWLVRTLDECRRIGDIQSIRIFSTEVGRILCALGDYEGSMKYHLCSLELRNQSGLPPSGFVLEGMGVAWAKMGKVSDAHEAFEEALKQYHSSEPTRNSRLGITRSQYFLRQLEHLTIEPTAEERSALKIWYSDDHIDNILVPLTCPLTS